MDYSFTDAETQPGLSAAQEHAQPVPRAGRTSWPVAAIVVIQSVLWLGHWLIYTTWAAFEPMSPEDKRNLGIALFLLSISFTLSAVLTFRYDNRLVAALYKVAAVWLGILNFLTWAACLGWLGALALHLAGADTPAARHWLGLGVFGFAAAVSLAGFVNARILRLRRLTVTLPNLPASWRGRTALLISDIHLGNVNGPSFARRIARIANRLNPSIIFIAGDLYDGSKADPERLAAPLFAMDPPLGIYFCGGNHEDFGDPVAYEAALRHGGIEVLHNQRVVVDGLQVAGVSYATSSHPLQLRAFLDRLNLRDGAASILLHHVPHSLAIVEKAGVDLQLSGHTHGGQVFPFTWITRRVFRQFTYGLQRLGNLQVLISSGVGTWGPPMRVGTAPEMVLITFA